MVPNLKNMMVACQEVLSTEQASISTLMEMFTKELLKAMSDMELVSAGLPMAPFIREIGGMTNSMAKVYSFLYQGNM